MKLATAVMNMTNKDINKAFEAYNLSAKEKVDIETFMSAIGKQTKKAKQFTQGDALAVMTEMIQGMKDVRDSKKSMEDLINQSVIAFKSLNW
jgi:hypothetical protein